MLEAIELRHRITALSATELVAWPVLPIVGNVLLWIWLSRWRPFCVQCGARGMPVVWCIGQRGNAFLQNVRRARSGGRSGGVLTAYPERGDSNSKASSHHRGHHIPSITW